MCGIVGVLGNHEAAPLLVEALKRLEYRGYDSAGIATVNGGQLDRRRAVGKLVNLSDLLVHEPLAGKSGIGHTRWATHGAATVTNAHPHRAGGVAVVHNGIIENFRELRGELAGDGYTQESETDTETVVLLTRRAMDRGATPVEAAKETLWPHFRDMMNRIGRERGWKPMSREGFEHEVTRGALHVGSPETVARKIAATVQVLGLDRFDMKYSHGTLPHDAAMRCIELYGTKVIPRVQELLAEADAACGGQ